MLERTPTNRLHADHLPSGQPRPSPAPDKVLLDAYSHAVTSVVDRIGPAVDQMTEFVLAGLGCRTQMPPTSTIKRPEADNERDAPGTAIVSIRVALGDKGA